MNWIEGETTHLYAFGDKVGQAEVEAKDAKSIKGDYYVMNSGLHNLMCLSAMRLPSAILSTSSSTIDKSLNGPITYITPDFCPIVGKCEQYRNLCFNFGTSSRLFDFDQEKFLQYHIFNAMQVSSIVLDDLEIDKLENDDVK